jgi:hypothetical protein
MKPDYVVCIPSYQRAEICNQKTLTTLKQQNIPANLIHVYVANKKEYDIYEKTLANQSFLDSLPICEWHLDSLLNLSINPNIFEEERYILK